MIKIQQARLKTLVVQLPKSGIPSLSLIDLKVGVVNDLASVIDDVIDEIDKMYHVINDLISDTGLGLGFDGVTRGVCLTVFSIDIVYPSVERTVALD